MRKTFLTILALAFSIGSSGNARDQIKIVGSSTVYPFATVVAEDSEKQVGLKHQLLNPPDQVAF